ncbi:MAG: protein kinase [Planctomycetes bacterium]|nr:protein kinase [Planctomycetota bacterium]
MAELKTFLFTDICRSVDLKNEMVGRSVTERDMAFIESILTPHRGRIEAHLEEQGGRVVSTAGDGHFLVFGSTIQAAQWAVDVQRDHRENPIVTPDGGQVEVRISVHVGVPQADPADESNFVGKSVDYASRLNDYATGEQILVSRSVMAILDDIGLEDISFHLHGRRHLKGIGRVEVHELIYDDHGPRALRQLPASHSDREWTVIPTVGFEGGGSDTHPRGAPASETLLTASHGLKHIGNYELEEMLGSGGMGDVYKGRHSQFDRVRAIKVIKPQFVAAGNQDVIRRFYQEIKAIGALEHKNIAAAIDSSAPTDRMHYLVMEYIDGVALNDLVEQHGPLPVADACEIIRQAARGLQFIHRHGMVHRDIKPSNLMLTLVDHEDIATDASLLGETEGHEQGKLHGVVKILDLGLALLSEEKHDRLTLYDNKAMGTGMYMSPEQWKTTSVDIRADIYSLGCTLYHLLAGHPPFAESDLRPEKAHEKSRIPPIRTKQPIPRKLWDILRMMLAKRPEDRYATPAEVAAELTPYVEGNGLVGLVQGYLDPEKNGSTVRHTKTDSGARVDTWLSRGSSLYPDRRWLLGTGLPLLVAALGVVFLLWSSKRSHQAIINESLQQAKNTLPTFAEHVAQEDIGGQLTERFRILQAAAAEPELLAMIERFDPELARQQLAKHELQSWIREHRRDNIDDAESGSWFLDDRTGKQIARHPLIDAKTNAIVDSFLQSYAYRNYFHGEKRDRPRDQVTDLLPITEPNLSAVYISSTTNKLKVALSVPVWNQPEESQEPTVVAVLAMSVGLEAFEVLSPKKKQGKDIIIADLRDDYLEQDPTNPEKKIERKGMVLQHPLRGHWKEENLKPRLAVEVLQAMEQNPSGFVSDYHDPLSHDPQAKFWGAYEPVEYEIVDPQTGKRTIVSSGWVVLTQVRAIDY